MARPREFDERAVLEAAQGAFRTHGYAGTSLQQLMGATGLGKGSLYAAFGDKRGLYLRVLGDYAQRSVASVEQALEGPRAIDALREHLLGLARSSNTGPSCLLASSTAELAAVDADVGQCVKRAFREIEASYVGAVTRAQDEGDIDADADPKALGGLLLAVSRGLEALGHAGVPETSLVQAVEAALAGLPRPPGR
ncbi:TetR/AcrR family transcriptional regulator [Solirubrobacter sp. CPCC 204708]|uniref:TetR/AcrR family transcriptional regulator n=1 Tax=Solirubrobacter deserti TaxID=2282478 RepID=A0ABT4RSW6_9ACTN|nr:TetR/AcrR family transcriptional regulator [Solirubrobacter deserti]MBE2320917.1 TetR/AcrR family transcriptional regulator [Solirubrobacter deserti]MDA0141686.1 TetR/AcrR family transcriptional regulator [Solirubrobacter deserti]